MTPSTLKSHIVSAEHDRYFFTRKTMKFFGDTMKNYGVRATTIDTRTERALPVWELYRKRPVAHGLQSSAYFDQATFAQVFPERAT